MTDPEAPYPHGCGPDCQGCDPCVCGHPWSDHDGRERSCYGEWCDCRGFDSLHKVMIYMPRQEQP